ncbi:hypothetical protein D3C76_1275830 [compost metagenome]
MSQRRTGQRIILLLAVLDDLHLLATDDLTTLQADQYVRHAHVREDLVVHTPRARRVFIERLQVTVEPIGATNTSDQGQVGRRRTEPGLGVSRLHADVHVIANLGAGEHQLVEHQLVRNAKVIGNTLVTLELGAVAAHAIVGERTRAILHRRLVSHVDVDFFQLRTAVWRREGQRRQGSKHQYSK